MDETPRRAEADGEEAVPEVTLSPERFAEMEAAEEMLLTVTDMGFGKRTSAYEYRVTGRGGQGIGNITLAPRNGKTVVATFPVRQGDDIMMVTDAGRLIRVPVDQVRITGAAGDGRDVVPRGQRRARHQRLHRAGGRQRRERGVPERSCGPRVQTTNNGDTAAPEEGNDG